MQSNQTLVLNEKEKVNVALPIEYQLKKKDATASLLSTQLRESGIHPVMADLYALRGIKDTKDINLRQKLEPWKNMKSIEKAAELLAQAILKKEKLCVVADYDVDGATACAIAVRGIRMFGGNIDFVVPNRFVHGYGLTPSVVDEAVSKKRPDWIITVDNGISSHAGVAHAKKKGVRVLVTDHHLPAETLPDAECVVNPNQHGCGFGSKSMAGCGVMFYVLCALRERFLQLGSYTAETIPDIFSLLDLVAIGTIADVVKLDLNNRIMVQIGLNLIRKKQTRAGIIGLTEVCKRRIEILTTQDIAFALAPRINAAGRLEDMTVGIQMLLTDTKDRGYDLAVQLDGINKNRKNIEGQMKEDALDLPQLDDTKFAKVAFSDSFHEGVVGIVASRLKEMFYRPVVVFAPSQEEGMIKGSGRSIPEVHLRDVFDLVSKKAPDILVKFGGHAMAAGLTIKKENLARFTMLFDESVEYFVQGKALNNIKEIDLMLDAKYFNIETADLIRNEIWGQGFNYPLFAGEFKIVDQKILKDAHLKLFLEKNGVRLEGMWFFRNEMLEPGEHNMVFSLGVNEFLGNRTTQIMVEGLLDNTWTPK